METLRLSRDRVLRTAVELADRHGLKSCSIRKVADELGVGAMSLYHHVPNKESMLGGMVDIVFSEIEPPAIGGDWKAEMRRRAISTRAALMRHRWAVGMMEGTRQPGPARARLQDAALGCLREAGFSIETTIQALSVQDAYVYGFALQEATLPFDDAEGSKELAAATTAGLGEEHPYLTEVVLGHVAKVGYDFDEAFLYGLDLILDALDSRRQVQA